MLCYEETFTQENLTVKSLASESWSALPLPQLGRHFTPGECSQEHRASPSECGQPRVWGSLSPPSPEQRMEALPRAQQCKNTASSLNCNHPHPSSSVGHDVHSGRAQAKIISGSLQLSTHPKQWLKRFCPEAFYMKRELWSSTQRNWLYKKQNVGKFKPRGPLETNSSS